MTIFLHELNCLRDTREIIFDQKGQASAPIVT